MDLIPSLEATAGAARFFAGARLGAAGTSALLPTGPAPAFGPLPTRQETSGTSARAIIGGVTFSTLARGGEATSVGYRAETGVIAGQRQTDHALSASIAGSRVMAGAAVGRRVSPMQSATHGSASLGIVATPVVTFQLAAGNYPSNPMLGTAAGRFVNAGLTMRLGRAMPSLPTPAGVKAPARGMTRLAIRASDARRVELGGDFNKWQLVPTQRAGNGVWYVDLALPPGEYRYAFRIDGKEWRVPEGVAAADDEFGGRTAWLTVSRTDARPSSK
ncbi:MAG TPA: glycogen-binding domain-containing protein [Gemmatimonadaceae bacterium]|nr:glycogen-binding domain-containing protein [Gemmatimonadaceae bacterium]